MSSDSDSPLSSPPESDDEVSPFTTTAGPVITESAKEKAARTKQPLQKKGKPKQQKLPFVRRPSTPPRKARKKEPPHVPTLADSPELASIIMFRSRFADAFKGVPNLGCQDIERGVVDSTPSEQVEQLLCRLLSLVLNRKKPVERGHHQRALEEAANSHKNQWPRSWEGRSPFSGSKSFSDLDAAQRLSVLQALIHWSLTSSEFIRGIIGDSYRGSRREDDLNVPLSVQPWGRDGDKRRYWLIEGNDDTPFRLYRESNPALKTSTWISIAGTIEEIQTVAKELEEEDASRHAIALKDKILAAIPRFERGDIRRKKREYRASRKALLNQPMGVSLYEGRTRGKRIRYNFSSDDEGGKDTSELDETLSRRGTRSTRATPAPDLPRFTASGRQIRKPVTGDYGEVKINGSNGTATGSRGTPYGSENGDYRRESGDEESTDGSWGSGTDDYDETAPKKSLKVVFKIPNLALTKGTSSQDGPPPERAHDVIRVASENFFPNGNGTRQNGVVKNETLANGEDIPMADTDALKEASPAVNGVDPPGDRRWAAST